MTPREFWNACDGYNEKVERGFRISWEQIRWLGAVHANYSLGSKRSIQPTDLVKFPWEKKGVDRSEEIELIKERRKWLQGR